MNFTLGQEVDVVVNQYTSNNMSMRAWNWRFVDSAGRELESVVCKVIQVDADWVEVQSLRSFELTSTGSPQRELTSVAVWVILKEDYVRRIKTAERKLLTNLIRNLAVGDKKLDVLHAREFSKHMCNNLVSLRGAGFTQQDINSMVWEVANNIGVPVTHTLETLLDPSLEVESHKDLAQLRADYNNPELVQFVGTPRVETVQDVIAKKARQEAKYMRKWASDETGFHILFA